MVVTMLSEVENKNVEIKEWQEHPFGPEEVSGHIVPVKVGVSCHCSFCP